MSSDDLVVASLCIAGAGVCAAGIAVAGYYLWIRHRLEVLFNLITEEYRFSRKGALEEARDVRAARAALKASTSKTRRDLNLSEEWARRSKTIGTPDGVPAVTNPKNERGK